MSVGLSAQPDRAATPAAGTEPSRSRRLEVLGWTCLAAILLINVPLFVHMPLDTDVLLYDVCARSLLHHGVEYRDVFQHGMPGMTWIQSIFRASLGWKFATLRVVDLAVFATIVMLLTTWLRRLGCARWVTIWTAAAVLAFYFSTSENNHCQRDVWMLVPALSAVQLRARRTTRFLGSDGEVGKEFASALGEGLLWGIAFWMKPFVAIPALACWLVTTLQIVRNSPRAGRAVIADTAGTLLGGVIIGAAGIGWLVAERAWPYFLEVMTGWNPQYYRFSRAQGWSAERFDDILRILAPWSLIHVVAVPLALMQLFQGLRLPVGTLKPRGPFYQAMFAAFYLGWFFQALFLQNLLQYIQVPPILLGLTVVAGTRRAQLDSLLHWVTRLGSPGRARPDAVRRTDLRRLHRISGWALAGFVALALVWHPMFQAERLLAWPRCLTEWDSAELRDDLSLNDQADWQDLEQVAKYLQEHDGAKDGRVTCYSFSTPGLYVMLEMQPSTRFVFLDSFVEAFPQRRSEIYGALRKSKEKFVVTDLRTLGFSRQRSQILGVAHESTLEKMLPPDAALEYPWSLPVAFRAGSYTVHAVRGPIVWPDQEAGEGTKQAALPAAAAGAPDPR